jgi:hypothetical protein
MLRTGAKSVWSAGTAGIHAQLAAGGGATATAGVARHMSYGMGGIKGMEGFVKQERLQEKMDKSINQRAAAEAYLAKAGPSLHAFSSRHLDA